MAPPTVSQTLTLAVSARGGPPPGGEDELITTIRQRRNAGAAADSDIVLRTYLLHGLAPLAKYLVRAHSDIGGWDATALGDYAFEVLKITAYRTKLMKRYAAVIDSTSHWAVVERGLLGVVGGRDSPAPPSLVAPTARASSSSSSPWWVSNWILSYGLGFLVALWMWYSLWFFASARGRLQAFACGMLILVLALMWRWHGPTRADFTARGFMTPEVEDEAESSVAPSEAGSDAASFHSPVRDRAMADELVAMKQELEELRAASPKAPSPAQPVQLATALPPPSSAPPGLSSAGPERREFDALQAFAGGAPATGPVSWLGADVAAAASRGPPPTATQTMPAGFMPAAGAPPGVPAVPIWDDAGRRRTAEQAEQILKGFTFYEASKALDAHWAARFWAWLDNNLSATLTPELFALLSGHGCVGCATLSPPRASFRDDLMAFRDTGAPLHGAGGAVPWMPCQMAAAALPSEGVAWQHQLAPDVKRGAPEIYRSLRSAGAATVRDWLNLNYSGSRQSDQWIDLWNIATSIDYRLGRCSSPLEETKILATDDYMEIGLRRLAAFMYEGRSKDQTGARRMLAVQAPGAKMDIAPEWMVSDATAYSKTEHQRDERVAAQLNAALAAAEVETAATAAAAEVATVVATEVVAPPAAAAAAAADGLEGRQAALAFRRR